MVLILQYPITLNYSQTSLPLSAIINASSTINRKEIPFMIKYKVIAEEIERRIRQKVYEVNTKLPTVDQLMIDFEASRNTIRKAIEILSLRGLVYQVQGSGIYIRKAEQEDCINIGNVKGISKDFLQKTIRSKLLDLTLIKADEELSKRMNCPIGTPIYRLKRQRFSDEKPLSIEYTYYNKEIIPYLNQEIAEKSIYSYIEDDLKLSIGFSDKFIHVSKLTADEAFLLDLPVGDPSLIVKETVYLANGLLFNISTVIYNYLEAHLFLQSEHY